MPKSKPPSWLDLDQPRSDRARTQPCGRCGQTILRALAGRTAALDVRADPTPLGPLEELLARLDGRLTWHLVAATLPGDPPRITWRDTFAIQAGPARHPVIADHRCPPRPRQETLL